jgi:hypothetical protein
VKGGKPGMPVVPEVIRQIVMPQGHGPNAALSLRWASALYFRDTG